MNLQVIHIPNSPLGKTVELRELTMDAFVAVNKATKNLAEDDTMETSMNYLAHMLFIDGKPTTRQQLGQFPMSAIMPLLTNMNELFGLGETEEGEG